MPSALFYEEAVEGRPAMHTKGPEFASPFFGQQAVVPSSEPLKPRVRMNLLSCSGGDKKMSNVLTRAYTLSSLPSNVSECLFPTVHVIKQGGLIHNL